MDEECEDPGERGNFYYQSVGDGGSEDDVLYDLWRLMSQHYSGGRCTQQFIFECYDTVLTNYQCINDQNTHLHDYAVNRNSDEEYGDMKCDSNSDHEEDYGTITSDNLPVTKFFPGDVDDDDEFARLALEPIRCSA
jgi:hypothetical protein